MAAPIAVVAKPYAGQFEFPEGYPDKSGAVVWIEKIDSAPAKAGTATIVQRDMRFLPHITVLSVGSTLVFKNEDPSIHGVKSEAGPLKNFRAVMTPKKKLLQVAVTSTGVSELLCDIHAQMNAFVIVVNGGGPHAISDHQGAYRLENLPEPPFTVKVWHEILPPKEFKITSKDALPLLQKIKLESWNE